MKALRWITVLLLVCGASLTGRAAYVAAKAELAGVLIRHAWREEIRTGSPKRPWPWADMHPIARLKIARIGYDEIVLDSATPRTLAFGPARVASGAEVDEPGNVVIAGHRTSWFRPLQDIRSGDLLALEWLDCDNHLVRRHYRVTTISVVEPGDTALLQPTAQAALTLVTCYPFGARPDSPQRFMVQASALE